MQINPQTSQNWSFTQREQRAHDAEDVSDSIYLLFPVGKKYIGSVEQQKPITSPSLSALHNKLFH